MWEDAYDPTDNKFPCKVDRSAGPLQPSQQLNLMNHNLNIDLMPIGRGIRIPDRLNSPRTNSVNSYVWTFLFFSFSPPRNAVIDEAYLVFFRIKLHASHCAPLENDQYPNFVLVDFVNIGQAVQAVAELNGFKH